jgi:dTDP-4-dehydrorhamnose 3,5-epimerase
MKRFKITDTNFEGLKLISRQKFDDQRGYLARLYCSSEMSVLGFCDGIAQINHSYTKEKGTIRGMHFQRYPYAEKKMVLCLRGEIWDVAIDLRVNSPTFMTWHAEKLSGENGVGLFIPEGFAHGFQTLTDDCELIYIHSVANNKNAEDGISPFDPALSISWPLSVTRISQRDKECPIMDNNFEGFR